MQIDAHHHLWNYEPQEFAWIDDSMTTIRRDFTAGEWRSTLMQIGLQASVAVQARQSREETEFLLQQADSEPMIAGVVGWAPLREPSVREDLERWKSHPAFVGVRHVLQGEAAEFFHDSEFHRGLEQLVALDLTYDLLIKEHQFPDAIQMVNRHPGLRVVLDHLGKPVATGAPTSYWKQQIAELARRPNTWSKFSGLLTEAPCREWRAADIQAYFDVVLEAFGPERILFGSDWPVCLTVTSHAEWSRQVMDCVDRLSRQEQEAILGANAATCYRLNLAG